MGAIIQLDFSDTQDYAAWAWIEWEIPGGIRAILETWKDGILMRYDMGGAEQWMPFAVEPDVERLALENIHRHARALRRYLNGNYRDVLTPYEQRMLDLECQCMRERQHLRGMARYEWIAEQMNRAGDFWTPRQIADVLDNTRGVLVALYEVELREKLARTLLAFGDVWKEAAGAATAAKAA